MTRRHSSETHLGWVERGDDPHAVGVVIVLHRVVGRSYHATGTTQVHIAHPGCEENKAERGVRSRLWCVHCLPCLRSSKKASCTRYERGELEIAALCCFHWEKIPFFYVRERKDLSVMNRWGVSTGYRTEGPPDQQTTSAQTGFSYLPLY